MALNLYTINSEYFKYLSSFDKKVCCSDETKEDLPYVGIILKVNDINFYAPLSSPKDKFLR